MSFNIEVEGGTSVRLPTAGKYCDRDIVVTATGGVVADPIIEPLEITENGTYTAPDGVDGYSPVTVNVPTGGGDNLDKLIDGTLTEVSSAATSVRSYAFYFNDILTSVDFPSATSVGAYAFYACASLASVYFPNATSIEGYVFNNCTSLASADFPKATSVGTNEFYACTNLASVDFPNATSIESYAFYNCPNLTSVIFPKAKSIGRNAFNICLSLESVDFPKVTSIGTNAFATARSLKVVIIRTSYVCTLSSTNAFTSCHHILGTTNATYNPTGAKDGYIYVPRDLVDSYKSATNWSTYASQFRAIEDYPEITGG
jgi:hypothetical protein